MATSRVQLAKAAWARLTGQRCKTRRNDVVPASDDLEITSPGSYDLESTALTSEGFPIALRAVYTIAPKTNAGNKPAAGEDPLPLNTAAPRNKDDCPSHVKKLFDGHVRALAAGTTTEQLSKGARGFVEQVLGLVQVDLAECGLCVHSANVQKLSVVLPVDRMDVAVVAKEGDAPATAYSVQNPPNQNMEFHFLRSPGPTDAVQVQPATTKLGFHVEVQEGSKAVRLIVRILAEQLSQSSVANGTHVRVEEESNGEAALSYVEAAEERAEYVATKMRELAGDLRAFKEFDGERIKDAAEGIESLAESLKAAAALLGRKTGAAKQVAGVSKATVQEKTGVATPEGVGVLPAESNAN